MMDTTTTQQDEHREADTKIEPFVQPLKVRIPDQKLVQRARRMAEIGETIMNKQAGFDGVKQAHKAQITALEAERDQLAGEIRDGTELVDVACRREYRYRLGSVREVRLDTNEVIDERALTANERQLGLELDDDSDGEDSDESEDFESATAGSPPEDGETVQPKGPEPELATEKKKGRKTSKGGGK